MNNTQDNTTEDPLEKQAELQCKGCLYENACYNKNSIIKISAEDNFCNSEGEFELPRKNNLPCEKNNHFTLEEFKQTVLKLYSTASLQSFSISAFVASGLRSV